jgi:hypothetical protein
VCVDSPEAKEERYMGEFDEETAIWPEPAEPAELQSEPAEPSSPAADPEPPASQDDPVASIQDQLALDDPAPGTAVDVAEVTDELPAGGAEARYDDAAADAGADELPDNEAPLESVSDGTDVDEEPPPGTEAVADDSTDDADTAVADDSAAEGAAAESTAEEDDLAAAIAASNEQVGAEGTLDDIAPGTAQPLTGDEIDAEAVVRYGAPWWPFLIYLGVWAAYAGVAIWQFEQLPAGAVVYESQYYTMFVFGGLALAVSGVFLTLAVWLGSRLSPKRQRPGLFSSALIKGSICILVGVVVWWGTLMALDYLRLGRLF